MLEPLIVLTVLNCFFMFSSTVTTCALWWQYRSHRCCFKKDTMQQSTRHRMSKGKGSNSSKKPANLKQDNLVHFADHDKSNTNVLTRENKCKKSCKTRPRTSTKYLLQSRGTTDDRASSMETTEKEFAEKSGLSEASQTDGKSAVVMEYSTVQKIVQILDNDTDLAATKLVIKDLNVKQNGDEKKELTVEPRLESLATPEEYSTETVERNN